MGGVDEGARLADGGRAGGGRGHGLDAVLGLAVFDRDRGGVADIGDMEGGCQAGETISYRCEWGE